MLAAKYALTKKKDFDRVEKEGQLYQSEAFGLAVYRRGDKEFSRFGFIVSNKISGDSFMRNRIKRALKEAIRQNFTYIKPGADLVFLVKTTALKKSTVDLMTETKQMLQKTKVLK